MIAKLTLDRKREGKALSAEEIFAFVDGFTRGAVPSYQMSALLMAICCRGMDARETADLTEAMRRSGESLAWPGPTADKHSTGGTGDKLSLVVQPLAAACGVSVPSLAGRGLGFTGGTVDKLESVPGYCGSLDLAAFRAAVARAGVSISGQTDAIAPADRRLYALRGVTGTVASVPLITASILSKKLAGGAHTLVFDVKCGSGAFMRTLDEARALARSLVDGARAAGRRSAALITDMSAPLGFAVGNANEVAEARRMLSGGTAAADGRLADVAALCVELAARMVALELEMPPDAARDLCRRRLADGSARARFEAMVAAHGGDLGRFEERIGGAPGGRRSVLRAPCAGYVASIDAGLVAQAAFRLGAGRATLKARIDPLAGVDLSVRRGDRVEAGAPLAVLTTRRPAAVRDEAAAVLRSAFALASEPPPPVRLVLETVD